MTLLPDRWVERHELLPEQAGLPYRGSGVVGQYHPLVDPHPNPGGPAVQPDPLDATHGDVIDLALRQLGLCRVDLTKETDLILSETILILLPDECGVLDCGTQGVEFQLTVHRSLRPSRQGEGQHR